MRGWILYKETATQLKPEWYEIERLLAAAKADNIELEVYAPDEFDLTVTREDNKSILLNGQAVELPDFIIPRMGSGTTYFALAIIRHLERLGVYCLNPSKAIEIVKDKLFSQQLLAEKNLPTPKTMLVKFPVDIALVERHLGFPVVIKTLSGSQGSGVFLSHKAREFDDLMQLIEATNKNANIILQEFIANSHGRDLRVFTIGGRVAGCYERRGQEDSFKANVSAGGSARPFQITPEIEWLATQTANILDLDVAGIDLLFDNGHYKICEANSSPGFEGLESCLNVDIAAQILHFIRIRLGMFNKDEPSSPKIVADSVEAETSTPSPLSSSLEKK